MGHFLLPKGEAKEKLGDKLPMAMEVNIMREKKVGGRKTAHMCITGQIATEEHADWLAQQKGRWGCCLTTEF